VLFNISRTDPLSLPQITDFRLFSLNPAQIAFLQPPNSSFFGYLMKKCSNWKSENHFGIYQKPCGSSVLSFGIYQKPKGRFVLRFGIYRKRFGSYLLHFGIYRKRFGISVLHFRSDRKRFGWFVLDFGSYQMTFGVYRKHFRNHRNASGNNSQLTGNVLRPKQNPGSLACRCNNSSHDDSEIFHSRHDIGWYPVDSFWFLA